ncbi:hypothetical protein IU433_04260 [Nocardia puris]|uniref:MYXO-CTERM domain-containing protein n=1 Tax=Nocardia puris TaxID=208602 RepID=A0A366DWE7_9NOCA|nr:hypothetical protein [Nocardia puris]MBF6209833.1 hypothetical protein [Nocardia puris]MBF6366405.1 hypothetical protein [Nocardia puris]MBF6458256.1 hypothetical protein [Nocardia puris]RBO94430.1 hypothetical protein DFR74_102853 [Nocardia puris]
MTNSRATVVVLGVSLLVAFGAGAAGATPPPANPWSAWLDPIILFIGQLLGLPGYRPGI